MELQGYHYYQGRIQSTTTCGYNIFSLYITWQPHYTKKNPNYKRRFHNGLNGPKGPSRSAHGQASLNLPLKTTQYYLGRVVKLDQIELGSIKPNSYAIIDLSLNCLVELKGTFQSLSCLLFNLVTDFIVNPVVVFLFFLFQLTWWSLSFSLSLSLYYKNWEWMTYKRLRKASLVSSRLLAGRDVSSFEIDFH